MSCDQYDKDKRKLITVKSYFKVSLGGKVAAAADFIIRVFAYGLQPYGEVEEKSARN